MGNCQAVDADGFPEGAGPIGWEDEDLIEQEGRETGVPRAVHKRSISDSGRNSSLENKEGNQAKRGVPHDVRSRDISVAEFQFGDEKRVGVAEFDFGSYGSKEPEKPTVELETQTLESMFVHGGEQTFSQMVVEEMDELREKLVNTRELLKESEVEQEKLREEIRKLSKKNNESVFTQQDLVAQVNSLQRQMEERDRERNHLERQFQLDLERHNLEMEERSSRMKKLQDLKSLSDSEAEELRNRLKTLEKHYQSSMTQNEELILKSREVDLANEMLKEELNKAKKEQKKGQENELTRQESERQIQSKKNQKLRAEIKMLNGIIENIREHQNKEAAAEKTRSLRQIEEKDSEIQHLERQIALQAERTTLEKSEFETRVKKLEEIKAVLESEAEEVRNRLATVEKHYQASMTQNEELVLKCRHSDLEKEKVISKNEELRKSLEDKKTEELLKIANLEEQIDVLMHKGREDDDHHQNLVEEINRLSQSREDLINSSMESLKKQATETEILKSQISSLSIAFNEQTAQKESLQEELDKLNKLKKKFEQTEMAQLYLENQELKEKIEMGMKTLSQMEQKIDKLTNTNQHLRKDVKDLAKKNEALEERKDDAEEDLATLQAKYMRAVQLAMEQEQYVVIEDRHMTKELSKRRSQLLIPGKGVKGLLEEESEADLSIEFNDIQNELTRLGATSDQLNHQDSLTDLTDTEPPSEMTMDLDISEVGGADFASEEIPMPGPMPMPEPKTAANRKAGVRFAEPNSPEDSRERKNPDKDQVFE